MIYTYPALVHEDDDGIWLEFPDLDGCHTFADTLDELLSNAPEALECHVLEELEHGAVLPLPSNIKEIATSEHTFTTLIRIDVDLAKHSKSIKKTLTIPYWLNEQATAKGINFSKTLQEALLAKVMA